MNAHLEHDKVNMSKVKNKNNKGGSTMKHLGITIIAVVIIVGITAAPVYAQSAGIYIVQPGDTLLKIAARYSIRVSQLAEANGLRWNSWVYVGQRLIIPDPQPISGTVYVVRRGDTLFSIARRSGTIVQAIMWANGLTSTRIYAGQRLLIPAPEASCPGAPPQRVRVGESARVCTAYEQVMVRAQPRRDSAVLTRLRPGRYVPVINGPVCANAFSWWLVRTDSGTVGWVAEGGDEIDPYFLCPVEQPSTPSEGWQAHTNERFGYTLEYPGDATLLESPQETGIQISGPLVGNERWPILEVLHYDSGFYHPPAGTDAAQWVMQFVLAYDEIDAGVEIADLAAVHLRTEATERSYASDEYYVIKGDQLFRISILHTDGREDWDLYNKFLQSFRFP